MLHGENFVLRHRCELVEFDFVERHQGKRQVVELGNLGNGGTIKRTDGNLCAGTSGGFELINGRAVRSRTHQQDFGGVL